jgi:NADH-quinone oxidoreductase subunit F
MSSIFFSVHAVIEGMAIGGFVMNASVGYNYIRGEFMEPFKRFEGALKEAYTAGLLGKDIEGSGVSLAHLHQNYTLHIFAYQSDEA